MYVHTCQIKSPSGMPLISQTLSAEINPKPQNPKAQNPKPSLSGTLWPFKKLQESLPEP